MVHRDRARIKHEHRKSKRTLLRKISRKPLKVFSRDNSEEPIQFNCGRLSCYVADSINHLLDNYHSDPINTLPKNPGEFEASLQDLGETFPRDHLGMSKQLRYCEFDQNGIKDYSLPEINPLEASGMHIVKESNSNNYLD